MAAWNKSAEHLTDLVQLTATALYRETLTQGVEAQLPPYLGDWLGRVRLLYGVPFVYLVPNEKLLPKESIRFFYIDRNWTDRLVDGALSVGKTTTRDYAHHQATNDLVVAELDNEERLIRVRLRTEKEVRGKGTGADLTGLLLRSAAVSGWPGLEVKAYKNDAKLKLLRMDRLAENVLFCLFNDIPTKVDIEEPREGIQFGVDLVNASAIVPSGFRLKLRHVRGAKAGEEVKGGAGNVTQTVAVPVRKGNRRVIHVAALHRDVTNKLRTPALGVDLGDNQVSSAELAVEMLQFPYRQTFEGDKEIDSEGNTGFSLGTVYTTSTFNIRTVAARLTDEEFDAVFPVRF
jgi:hypothetical protein